ncbi:MAG: UDP-N-acetylglucosamine 2-epimerase (non-hydrolyzing) [Candidatus Electryonea clarkiae]|nr:UDP-N-acetylglucosamine 2-epimerase (non-hydrolyzing) [Candidatus Electryonea clarkiae]MDP8288111.1 UDP-N-acetylglucosamine 2-epimerase (non-hydrolyzing) [Candidatus Electryonea clarkiae]
MISRQKKIINIVGARPQFVKAATISNELRKKHDVDEVLLHTGQHYDDDLSEIFFQELMIPKPKYNLGVGSASHGIQTAKILEGIEKPDIVVVYGDTNSTLAGALAAVKLHIPIAHIEAGLRSFNKKMPEEVNRILTDHAVDLLFAPTKTAVRNLLHEGVNPDIIFSAGDVMYDAALFYLNEISDNDKIINDIGVQSGKYILATIHRQENTDDPARLRSIFDGLCQISEEYPVVLPLHHRTSKVLENEGMLAGVEKKLHLLNPIGYLDMLTLEKNSCLIVTDSGGIQKEAYFCKVPCVTLRDQTEWVELLDSGWNTLNPTVSAKQVYEDIVGALSKERDPDSLVDDLYGGGKASKETVEIIVDYIE